MSPRYPSFIIIGAVKSATTWLSQQLRQHDAIYMPAAEPQYFSSEYHRGVEWYASLFAPARAEQTIGEKSATYLAHPEAAPRMAKLVPEVRLITKLRDPVERAYSHYCMLYRRGTVKGSFEQYLDPADPIAQRFLEGGLYGQHLSRYLDHFPAEQIITFLLEDIAQDPEHAYKRLCAHIGVDLPLVPETLGKRVNDSRAALLPLPLRRALKPLKKSVAPLRSEPWFQALHRALARKVEYPPMTPAVRSRLYDYYWDDIERLQKILGRSLRAWLPAEREALSAG